MVRARLHERPELRENEPADDGSAKLLELVRALTADPAVQATIREDAELRRLWSDPGVRERILSNP